MRAGPERVRLLGSTQASTVRALLAMAAEEILDACPGEAAMVAELKVRPPEGQPGDRASVGDGEIERCTDTGNIMDGRTAAFIESVECKQAIGDTPTWKRDVTQFVVGEGDVVEHLSAGVGDFISVFDRFTFEYFGWVGGLGEGQHRWNWLCDMDPDTFRNRRELESRSQ